MGLNWIAITVPKKQWTCGLFKLSTKQSYFSNACDLCTETTIVWNWHANLLSRNMFTTGLCVANVPTDCETIASGELEFHSHWNGAGSTASFMSQRSFISCCECCVDGVQSLIVSSATWRTGLRENCWSA